MLPSVFLIPDSNPRVLLFDDSFATEIPSLWVVPQPNASPGIDPSLFEADGELGQPVIMIPSKAVVSRHDPHDDGWTRRGNGLLVLHFHCVPHRMVDGGNLTR